MTITGFGTINGTEYGLGYERGASIDAVGGTLTLNGDIYSGTHARNSCGRDLLVTRRRPAQCQRAASLWQLPRALRLPLQRQRDASTRHRDRAAILRDERHHRQHEREHKRRPD